MRCGVKFTGTLYTYSSTGDGVNVGSNNQLIIADSATLITKNNGSDGMELATGGRFGTVTATNNGTRGVFCTANCVQYTEFRNLTSQSNGTYGIDYTGSGPVLKIYSYTSSGNSTGSVFLSQTTFGKVVIVNPTISEGTEVTIGSTFNYNHCHAILAKDGASDAATIHFFEGQINTHNGADRHTASGVAWQLKPQNASWDENFPLEWEMTPRLVNANQEVTLSIWMKRSNTALTQQLVIKGGRIAGVSSDVILTNTAGADTYQEFSTTFTPTETGTIVPVMRCYGGTTHTGTYDDISISQ